MSVKEMKLLSPAVVESTPVSSSTPVVTSRKPAPRPKPLAMVVRTATPADARAIHTLITAHLAEGHLLPRSIDDLTAHASRFVVAVQGRTVTACGELAPLSHTTAEIRSLVVAARYREKGLGNRIVDELRRRATSVGFHRLCAFTHQPSYFTRLGFSIVPHLWVPEKIFTDCHQCPKFLHCGQYAMALGLGRYAVGAEQHGVPAADHAPHGRLA